MFVLKCLYIFQSFCDLLNANYSQLLSALLGPSGNHEEINGNGLEGDLMSVFGERQQTHKTVKSIKDNYTLNWRLSF